MEYCIWRGEGENSSFFYYNPLVAVLLKSCHNLDKCTKLCKVTSEGQVTEKDGQIFSENFTIGEELEIPEVSNIQKIAFGILCALQVCKQKDFVFWANDWLSGKDRSKESADFVRVNIDFFDNFSACCAMKAVVRKDKSSDFYANVAAYSAIKSSPCINVADIAAQAMQIK